MLTIDQIREILPHRYPMLLVDRILEISEARVVGIKNVTSNEPFFQGHFPDYPIMPGVLVVEAMAQCGGVLALRSIPDRANKVVLFRLDRRLPVQDARHARRSASPRA